MKISIITPNFNGGKYLEETILSVLNQNYPDLEYIIIDGGSTDNSVDIIKKYEKQLAYWVSEPDKGMYDAIQKGFQKSSGDLMAWLNSDDMYHRNALFTVSEIFQTFEDVNWLVGASSYFDEKNRTVACSQSKSFSKLDFYNRDYKWIQQESVFWRRSLWEKVGGKLSTELKYAGDFHLWLNFLEKDRLFVSHALIGGFRLRSENQFSLEHYEDYLAEVESLIDKIQINPEDQKILDRYKLLCKIESAFRKFKLFRSSWISYHYRQNHFGKQNVIKFDRHKMIFIKAL